MSNIPFKNVDGVLFYRVSPAFPVFGVGPHSDLVQVLGREVRDGVRDEIVPTILGLSKTGPASWQLYAGKTPSGELHFWEIEAATLEQAAVEAMSEICHEEHITSDTQLEIVSYTFGTLL